MGSLRKGAAPGRRPAFGIALMPMLGLALGLLLAPGATGPARATCIDYGDYAHRAGWAPLPGAVWDVASFGALTLAADAAGLHLLDLSLPQEPQILGEYPLPGARGLAVAGETVFAIDGDGLKVLSYAEPFAPELLAELPLPVPGLDLEVADGLACVAADTAGVYVIDVSDPLAPVLLAQWDTPYHAVDLAIEGGYVFVADRHSLQVFALPSGRRGSADLGRPDASLHAVTVADGYAYLIDENFGIMVFDVSAPLAPAYAGQVSGSGRGGILAAGGRLYSGSSPGLLVSSLEKPASPSPLCTVNSTGDAAALLVAGDYVYAAIPERAQIDILDCVPPATPAPLDELIFYSYPSDVDLAADGYAYVACNFDGLAIVDARDPAALVLEGYAAGLTRALETAIQGQFAYVAASYDGFKIVDISQPDGAHVVGGLPLGGYTLALDLAGQLAYVADLEALHIIDISLPSAPVVLGSLLTASPATAVCVTLPGSRLVLADGAQLLLADIEQPEQPAVLEELPLPVRSLVLADDLLCALGDPGLWTFRVEPDGALTPLGSLPLPGYPANGSIRDGIGYFANNGGGLQIVDLSEPALPRTVGSIPRWPAGVVAGAEALFVADFSGLASYPLHGTATGTPGAPAIAGKPALLASYPNPFNPSTLLAYRLPAPCALQLTVHDAQGRLLRCLAEGRQEAGEHSVAWDGRDERGRPQPSGVYFARLAAAGEIRGQRLILLK
jgi:hypothetical protein